MLQCYALKNNKRCICFAERYMIYCIHHKQYEDDFFNFLPPVISNIVREYEGSFILYDDYLWKYEIEKLVRRYHLFILRRCLIFVSLPATHTKKRRLYI
jgi:hypothetical protein